MEESAMRSSRPQNIDEAEKTARTRLLPELQRHLDVAGLAFNTISDLTAALPNPIPDPGQATRAAVLLVLRLANDLRAAQIVAVRGYPAQTLGLVASMYEVAHTVGYIGADEDIAQQWDDHDDPTRPFQPVTRLTTESLHKLGATDSTTEAEDHYRRYSQLCWGKHAWPQFEKNVSIQQAPSGEPAVVYGPNTTEYSVRVLWFALENAIWCAHVGMRSMCQFHLVGRVTPSLAVQMNDIAAKFEELQRLSVSRWGSVDPFPGRWRIFNK